MPRYFFHFETRGGDAADAPGIELPDDETAIREAGRSVGQMLADDLVEGCLSIKSRVRVMTDEQRTIAIVSVDAKIERVGGAA